MGDDTIVISLSSPTVTAKDHDESALSALTRAEREVVLLVLAGASSNEVAVRRGTSSRTVANQLASAFRKLAVNGRTELAARLGSLPAISG